MHFGMVCPPTIGHLNPMLALALELRRRGHIVIMFTIPDGAKKLVGAPLEVITIGRHQFPAGSFDKVLADVGKESGGTATLLLLRKIEPRWQRLLLEDLPDAIRTTSVQMLLVDQVSRSAGSVAEFLHLPFVTICNALPLNIEMAVPPIHTVWKPSRWPWSRLRNQLAHFITTQYTLRSASWKSLLTMREQWDLPPLQSPDDADSPLPQIAQIPRAFDFPRKQLPSCFHYVGPMMSPSDDSSIMSKSMNFPWEKLDGRPLIYVSMGSILNGRPDVFETLAAATSSFNAQVVITLGQPAGEIYKLSGNPIVVPYAPQQRLIEQSTLVISHAGLNTVMMALKSGVPVLAIPNAFEQPGIAARLVHYGAGRLIPIHLLDQSKLRNELQEILNNPIYRRNARRLQNEMQSAGGVSAASDLIEHAALQSS